MASNYTSRLTIWINGKEVENSIKAIKGEMSKLVNEQKRMIIGSKEYVAAGKQIKSLNTIIANHNAELRGTASRWSGLAKAAAGFIGGISFAGVLMGARKAIEAFNTFEEKLDNLSALTGLTGENLEWLGEQAKTISSSVLEGGIRITKSADDIVDAFTKMGSARPELLKNKEALVQVTQQALILAQAAKIDTLPAIEAVAASMNQFSLGAEQSTRIINTLGAGSLEGSAEVADLTESLSTVGTVAANSNMSLEDTVGTLETLAERQLKGAEAGTQLKSSLISLKAAGLGYASGVFNMRDALVELKAKMDGKATAQERDNELISVFGKRNITVGTILTANIGRYDYFTKAVTGTNTALEQAAINSKSNAAQLEQAKNRINVTAIALGEKLTPALTAGTNGLARMAEILSATIGWMFEYKGLIITSVATIIAYTATVKLMDLWERRKNAESVISIAIAKLKKAAMLAEIAVTQLWAAATMLATGNIRGAAQAMRVFNTVLKANPIGLIVGTVIALGTALYFLSQKTTSAQKAQQALTDMEAEAMKSVVDQKMALQDLLKIAKDETKSKTDRQEAIKKLNELSPEYLGNLTLEKINTIEAKKATESYIDSLMKQARVMAAQEKMKELEKQKIDLQISGKRSETSFWQDLGNGMISMGNAATFASLSVKSMGKNYVGTLKDITAQEEALLKLIDGNKILTPTGSGVNTPGKKEAKIKESTGAVDTLKDAFAELGKKITELDKQINNAVAAGDDPLVKKLSDEKKAYEELLETYKIVKEQLAKGWSIPELNGSTSDTPDIQKLVSLGAKIVKPGISDRTGETGLQKRDTGLGEATPEDAAQAVRDRVAAEEAAKQDLNAQIKDAAFATASNLNNAIFDIVKNRQQAEFDHKMSLLDKERERELSNKNLTEAQKDAINAKYAKKEAAIKKDAFKKEKAASIIQAIISTALAVANANRLMPPANIPAMIVAAIAGAAQIAVIASQKEPEFYEGGFTTTSSNSRRPAGVVHDNEYVVPEEGVKNPYIRSILNGIEIARIKKTLPTLNPMIDWRQSRQMFSGGFSSAVTSTTGNPATLIQPYTSTTDPILLAIIKENSEVMKQMMQNGVRGKWILNDLEKIQKDKSDIQSAGEM